MRNACAHRVRECDFKDEGCQFMVSHENIYFDTYYSIVNNVYRESLTTLPNTTRKSVDTTTN